jgi:hypothetical protein
MLGTYIWFINKQFQVGVQWNKSQVLNLRFPWRYRSEGLLEYDTVQSSKCKPTFQRNFFPPSSGHNRTTGMKLVNTVTINCFPKNEEHPPGGWPLTFQGKKSRVHLCVDSLLMILINIKFWKPYFYKIYF